MGRIVSVGKRLSLGLKALTTIVVSSFFEF
jgi:hypothetical protein